MSRIPDHIREEVLERIAVEAIVGETVQLKRISGGIFEGLCPFHGEKTASFTVTPARRTYHCFGCGEHGNAIDFIMKTQGLTFPEALRKLADRAGVVIEERELTPAELRIKQQKVETAAAAEKSCAFFEQQYAASPAGPAAALLKSVGVSDETAKEFRLGFAPDGFDGLKKVLEPSRGEFFSAVKAGLLRQHPEKRTIYDALRNRLTMPVLDTEGRALAFAGMGLSAKVKPAYLAPVESVVFRPESHLFGLHQAREDMRQHKALLLASRPLDLPLLFQAGFGNVAVPCTETLVEGQVRAISRYTDRVILVAMDEATLAQAFAHLDALLVAGFKADLVCLPNRRQILEALAAGQGASLRDAVERARPALEVYIGHELAAESSATVRSPAVERILAKFRLLANDIARALYCKALADKLGVDERQLASRLTAAA